MTINLSPAALSEKPVLKRLLELYLYDFSEFSREDLSDQGEYIYGYLDYYWIEENRLPFLIRVDAKLAGFALVRDSVDADNLLTHHMAEFFILKKYRRKKIGQMAAFEVFDRFPGRWQVSQIAENLPAQKFWRTIISQYTQGNYQEFPALDGDGVYQEFIS